MADLTFKPPPQKKKEKKEKKREEKLEREKEEKDDNVREIIHNPTVTSLLGVNNHLKYNFYRKINWLPNNDLPKNFGNPRN